MRRGDVERVRILERCGIDRGENMDVLVVRSQGSRGGTGDGGNVGEGEQGRQEWSFWALGRLGAEGDATWWRGYGPKDVFGRVLKFGGRGATGRE